MSDGGQTDLGGNGGIVFGGNERLLRLGRPLVPEPATTGLPALLRTGVSVLYADTAVLSDRGSTCARGHTRLAPAGAGLCAAEWVLSVVVSCQLSVVSRPGGTRRQRPESRLISLRGASEF
jgi:hypothetical protein